MSSNSDDVLPESSSSPPVEEIGVAALQDLFSHTSLNESSSQHQASSTERMQFLGNESSGIHEAGNTDESLFPDNGREGGGA
jgi:hypothetical protein